MLEEKKLINTNGSGQIFYASATREDGKEQCVLLHVFAKQSSTKKQEPPRKLLLLLCSS